MSGLQTISVVRGIFSIMMKIDSVRTERGVDFNHYEVIKKSDNYYAVTRGGEEITSGTSLSNACKKARLLEIGFQHGKEIYCEW